MQDVITNIAGNAVVIGGAVYALVAYVRSLNIVSGKYLPIVSASLGAIIGAVLAIYAGLPVIDYVLAGIVAGFGATGADQVAKQLRKEGE